MKHPDSEEIWGPGDWWQRRNNQEKREEAYVESQIRRNRKWHSFFYFLRFLLTGKD